VGSGTEGEFDSEGIMPQSSRLYTAGKAGATQANRVAINVQGSTQNVGSLPQNQSITTTAETAITDPGLANAYPLALAIPPGGPCEQEIFSVAFSGYVTTAQSATCIFKLRFGDSATITSNTLLVTTTTSGTIATASVPFAVEVKLVYDSVSGDLDILSAAQAINGVTTAPTIGSAPFSKSISNTANPVMTFTLTVTFSSVSTGPNTVNLKDFGVNH
jgi:hypothetical protein